MYQTFRSQLPLQQGWFETKETIDSHFIAWTSSVLVAFEAWSARVPCPGTAEATLTLKPTVPEALPDLYVIVSELFKQFYLMRTGQACGKQTSKADAEEVCPCLQVPGISVLLLFFGGLLLVREESDKQGMRQRGKEGRKRETENTLYVLGRELRDDLSGCATPKMT